MYQRVRLRHHQACVKGVPAGDADFLPAHTAEVKVVWPSTGLRENQTGRVWPVVMCKAVCEWRHAHTHLLTDWAMADATAEDALHPEASALARADAIADESPPAVDEARACKRVGRQRRDEWVWCIVGSMCDPSLGSFA